MSSLTCLATHQTNIKMKRRTFALSVLSAISAAAVPFAWKSGEERKADEFKRYLADLGLTLQRRIIVPYWECDEAFVQYRLCKQETETYQTSLIFHTEMVSRSVARIMEKSDPYMAPGIKERCEYCLSDNGEYRYWFKALKPASNVVVNL